jgi:hypothetical protein
VRRLAPVVLAGLLAAASAAPVVGAEDPVGEAAADSTSDAWEDEVQAERSWFWRTVYRYFGRAPRSDAGAYGQAEAAADRFVPWAGRTIEVVIVHPVLRFEREAADGSVSRGVVERLTSSVWSYTRESIVRQYLLFAAGDRVDPYKLADSERLVRQLEYMNDARVMVLPIAGGETVAIVVETRDRFPLGVTGTIHNKDRFDGSVYLTNTFGVGLRVDAKLLVNNAAEPSRGHRIYLEKGNAFGSFVNARVEHEDSWRELKRSATLDRPASHPDIRWVGGAQWQRTDVRDNAGVPYDFEQNDAWIGRVLRLNEDDPFRAALFKGRRQTLTPAVSYLDVDHHARPEVRADTLRQYHDRHVYLASLTYRDLADYKTSYLFRMGETEDVSDGFAVRATLGYEDGEFLERALGYLEYSNLRLADTGRLRWFSAGIGGHLHAGRFEDGLATARFGAITPLMGQEAWRQRWYLQVEAMTGLKRTTSDGLDLSRGPGIHDLPRNRVRGDKRVTGKVEWRIFTPWRLLGFDTMLLNYADVGVVGGQSDPLLDKKIYGAIGTGVRFYNPDLVIPTVELRVGLTRSVDDSGFFVAFDAGNGSFREFRVPGTRPGVIAYE